MNSIEAGSCYGWGWDSIYGYYVGPIFGRRGISISYRSELRDARRVCRANDSEMGRACGLGHLRCL
jgi:hypothetical protein